MVRTFQLTKALSKLTCIDNMKLGATGQKGESIWRGVLPFLWREQEAEIEARADALLERFKMDHMRNEFAGTLSGGQRKLLEMARALMVEPTMVMLDEPMAGVNPALTQSLLGHITGLRDQGMTVLFVEHDMDMVQEISDWVVVMAEGRIIAEGPPTSIGQNQAVVDAYLGTSPRLGPQVGGRADERDDHARTTADRRRPDAGYIPGVNILNGCSLTLAEGELIGIIGPNGAGKSTLVKAMFGLVNGPRRAGPAARRGHHRT
jgi:ABC-type branched-subunit amino acid transport system ATPase component